MTAVLRQLVPQNGAALVNLGPVDFASITPDTLSSLTYSTTPIDGNNDPSNKLTTNDVFAVRTSSGNYAKVKVVAYGYDLQLHWVTYHLDAPYQVLGTGYTNPEDVKASADGAHAYVTERNGDLVRVALANANRPMATVVASGMTAPQQMFLDEAHHAAYVVEYAAAGRLWRIDLTSGTKVAVLSNLENAVGVVLTSDLQSAYISEQAAAGGRVSRFDLATGTRHDARHGANGAILPHVVRRRRDVPACRRARPGESHHRDRRRCRELACRRERLARTPFERGHAHPGQILVCSDQKIEEADLSGIFQPARPASHGHRLRSLRQGRRGDAPRRHVGGPELLLPSAPGAFRRHAAADGEPLPRATTTVRGSTASRSTASPTPTRGSTSSGTASTTSRCRRRRRPWVGRPAGIQCVRSASSSSG